MYGLVGLVWLADITREAMESHVDLKEEYRELVAKIELGQD